MKIADLLTDGAILAELGERMARRRLDLQLTQADLAEQAGVAKRTVERMEAGASAQMSSMIRILRVLDLLPGLDRMIPEAQPGPMDLLKRKGKVRQRASKRGRTEPPDKPWSWGNDD
jgi:transcriptional regulator with XRE-family HTH domain